MDLAAKLQLKPNQPLKGVGTPHSVSSEIAELGQEGAGQTEAALLFFITDRAALEDHRAKIVEAASRDHLTWVAYPKAGHLGTDLNRDSLAALLVEWRPTRPPNCHQRSLVRVAIPSGPASDQSQGQPKGSDRTGTFENEARARLITNHLPHSVPLSPTFYFCMAPSRGDCDFLKTSVNSSWRWTEHRW